MKSSLLLDERPLLIMPELAKKIGLNESIILQQINYWLNKQLHYKDSRFWVYQTYKEWQEQFPFWSVSTIKRTIASLEKKNLIIKSNYNKLGFDKTVWYSINFEEVESLENALGHNEPRRVSKGNYGESHIDTPNTLDSSKTPTNIKTGGPVESKNGKKELSNIVTSELPNVTQSKKERESKSKEAKEKEEIKKVVEYLNDKAGKNFRHTTNSTSKSIKARLKDGFTVIDCLTVIDIKVDEWINSDMEKFIRPETLFGGKFESYLNQKSVRKKTSKEKSVDDIFKEFK